MKEQIRKRVSEGRRLIIDVLSWVAAWPLSALESPKPGVSGGAYRWVMARTRLCCRSCLSTPADDRRLADRLGAQRRRRLNGYGGVGVRRPHLALSHQMI